ncbi:MAG TPA: DUF3617 family protein [Nitrospirota bacterium]|nr:DUF3617 family protein [Nitrospirota bacterium]
MITVVKPELKYRSGVAGFLFLAVFAFAAFPYPANAEDLPVFRQGMWEFQRTAGQQKMVNKKCTSPTEDMKQQNAMLANMGCRVSPLTKKGNAYTFTAECAAEGSAGGQVNSHTTTVVTVESDSAYTVQVDGTINDRPTKELLAARRIGDCKR